MPKGVEHVNTFNSPTILLVEGPMMPKGVEHGMKLFGETSADPVEGPMMPKGVEHSVSTNFSATSHNVEGPMMPKGVEHNIQEIKARYPHPWKDQ